MSGNRNLVLSLLLASVASAGALGGEVTIRWHSAYADADTVSVWADVEIVGDDFAGFCSSVFSVVAADTGSSASLDHDETEGLGRWFRFDGASPGSVVGGNILDIDQFQLPSMLAGGEFDGSALIERFFAFEYYITDFTPRTVAYTSEHLNFNVYTDALGTNVEYHTAIVPTSFDIATSVVPLPAPWVLTGVGLGVVTLQRRRVKPGPRESARERPAEGVPRSPHPVG